MLNFVCVDTGVAGLSIEDFSGREADPLYDFDLAVKHMRADARDAINKAVDVLILTAPGQEEEPVSGTSRISTKPCPAD